jgi:hypothetical protein
MLDPPGALHGETRTRTEDTAIFSRVLYQLSYLAARRNGIGIRGEPQRPEVTIS